MFSNSNETPSPERLPALSSLPPPSDLFTSTAPYILTVSFIDKPGYFPSLVVDCSHEPTLKLLKGYLEKWGKASLTRVESVESDFIRGKMDALVVQAGSSLVQRGDAVNATVILAFIEGVLGYKMVSTTGSFWMYRRTTLFT